jgi:hypothetical protein
MKIGGIIYDTNTLYIEKLDDGDVKVTHKKLGISTLIKEMNKSFKLYSTYSPTGSFICSGVVAHFLKRIKGTKMDIMAVSKKTDILYFKYSLNRDFSRVRIPDIRRGPSIHTHN